MAYPPQGTYHGPTHPMAGINDPPVKLLMTGVNFFILYMLQLQVRARVTVRVSVRVLGSAEHRMLRVEQEMLDPSETPRAQNVTADWLA